MKATALVLGLAAMMVTSTARAEDQSPIEGPTRTRGIAFLSAGIALVGLGIGGAVGGGMSCSKASSTCTPAYLGAGAMAAGAPLVVLGIRDLALPVTVTPTRSGAMATWSMAW